MMSTIAISLKRISLCKREDDTVTKLSSKKSKLKTLKTKPISSILKSLAKESENKNNPLAKINPNDNESVKPTRTCLCVISFLCTKAGPIPIMLISFAKPTTTISACTTQKLCTSSRCAKTDITAICNIAFPNEPAADHINPLAVLSVKLLLISSSPKTAHTTASLSQFLP